MSPRPDTPLTPAPDKTAAIFATANPWLTGTMVGTLIGVLIIMGATLTGLLIHQFGSTDDRLAAIDGRFAAIDGRFARLETNIDARFAAQDAKIAALDAKIAEMSLKLTALIAALNKTDEVDAALAGDTAPP